jgi:hypothetical protein
LPALVFVHDPNLAVTSQTEQMNKARDQLIVTKLSFLIAKKLPQEGEKLLAEHSARPEPTRSWEAD